MRDITDIKSIIYTEKTLGLNEKNVIVVRTGTKMTKNSLKTIFRDYFGVIPLKINSLNQSGKVKRFRGRYGKQVDFKKFYVTLPENAKINEMAV